LDIKRPEHCKRQVGNGSACEQPSTIFGKAVVVDMPRILGEPIGVIRMLVDILGAWVANHNLP